MTTPAPFRSIEPPPEQDDPVRWLALLIRQGLLLIVAGIERRYGLLRDRGTIETSK